jgi:hypothetical protein
METTMPFGKHKGQPLSTVPRGYLRWLRANVDIDDWLQVAVDAILDGPPIPEIKTIDELVGEVVKDADSQLQEMRRARG